MRQDWVLLAGLLCGMGATARAEIPEEPTRAPPDKSDFWRDVLDPHADEVQNLIGKAQSALDNADRSKPNDLDANALETRNRVYRDVFNILTYARRLSPDNITVLALLGRAADETGKTRQAIDALQTITQLVGPEKSAAEVTGRLGLIYLRQNQLDDAVRWLRIAQVSPSVSERYGSATNVSGAWLVYLATALSLRGETAAAVDVLSQTPPAQAYYGSQQAFLPFALAVQLDRDEQRTAAFEVLEKLQSVMSGSFGTQVQNDIALFRFAPPEDVHYYQALLYESVGANAEARAEWVIYAAGDTPYRRRALDHVALIDGQRPPPPVAAVPNPLLLPPPPMIHRIKKP